MGMVGRAAAKDRLHNRLARPFRAGVVASNLATLASELETVAALPARAVSSSAVTAMEASMEADRHTNNTDSSPVLLLEVADSSVREALPLAEDMGGAR